MQLIERAYESPVNGLIKSCFICFSFSSSDVVLEIVTELVAGLAAAAAVVVVAELVATVAELATVVAAAAVAIDGDEAGAVAPVTRCMAAFLCGSLTTVMERLFLPGSM